ncbi:MAG TPA: DUF5611 family protein [Thermoplasmata archaeon]|nr:DUF5611 family protein [Thermoplasmata archaeon]
MQKYPVRAADRKNLTLPALEEILRGCFGEARTEGDVAVAVYGAISRLAVRPEGRELWVDPKMNPQVTEDVARETIRRYNQFLETATGFSAKERAKRLRKSAGRSDSGG